MVNSAAAAISEFKTQRLGSLLSGTGSSVDAPRIGLADTSAADRMARNAPKKSSTAFMDNIRQSGKRLGQLQMQGIQAKQALAGAAYSKSGGSGGSSGYNLPNKPGVYNGQNGRLGPRGGGGDYGLTVPASNALRNLNQAAQRAGVGALSVTEGYRSIETQNQYWAAHQNGSMPQAVAEPGTSVHGWGQAVDLGGGGSDSGSRQHAWLRANAAQFHWYWVGQNFGEDWHWEYHSEW